MHKTKFIIAFLLFIFITPIQTFCAVKPAVLGVFDMSVNQSQKISLKGEWLYFADTLINPDKIDHALKTLEPRLINVPTKRHELKGSKYGTYYLKIINANTKKQFLVNSLTIYSAASVFIDANLTGHVGKPGNLNNNTQPGLMLKSTPFTDTALTHNLVIHFSNFSREKDGIANNIYLETPQTKLRESTIQLIKYSIILGTILFIIFNQFNLYIMRRTNFTSLFFGIAALSIFIYIMFMGNYYLAHVFTESSFNFKPALTLWRTSYYTTVCFFALYIWSLWPQIFWRKILYVTIVYCSLSALATWFLPMNISSKNFNFFMIFTLLIGIYSVIVGIIAFTKRDKVAGLFVLGFALFITTVINDVLHNLLIIKSVNLLDLGIFFMVLTQAHIINSKLNRSMVKSEKLSQNLKYINTNLEQIVRMRTSEIEAQKAEIEAQRDEIIKQRDFAQNQHKLIARQSKTITDSINYAREIQLAVLPDERNLKQYFNDNFILFLPKDAVSGDFYWINRFIYNNQQHVAFCVADCTGHGVPGALLSMLGMSILNEIIWHETIDSSAKMLEFMRERFNNTMSEHITGPQAGDGMHITLCILNTQTGRLKYSGAYQSLFHIRNNQVYRLKGTNCIIGNYYNQPPFTEHVIKLEKGDRLYLFTDGFSDQMSSHSQGRFMQKRLVDLLASFNNIPFIVQKQKLYNEFIDWKGSCEQIDDVLVMGVKY